MSLISLEKLKEFLDLEESYADSKLETIRDGVEAEVAKIIKQPLEEATETEYLDGNRTNTIILKYGLVSAITSIKIDTDHDGQMDYTLTEHSEYEYYPNGTIRLRGGYFAAGFKNIEVVYKHGYKDYDALPSDLRLVLLKMMSNAFHASVVAIEKTGEAKVFDEDTIKRVLDSYRRIAL